MDELDTDHGHNHTYTPGDTVCDYDGHTWLIQRRLIDIEVPSLDKDGNLRPTADQHRRKYEIVGRAPDDENLHDVVSELTLDRWTGSSNVDTATTGERR